MKIKFDKYVFCPIKDIIDEADHCHNIDDGIYYLRKIEWEKNINSVFNDDNCFIVFENTDHFIGNSVSVIWEYIYDDLMDKYL